jgi:SulP family sulfate permease
LAKHTETRYRDAERVIPLRALPGRALRESIRQGYTAATLRSDVLAGLVVGVVALPLSMALAIAVQAPPQHGLYTAIVAGFITALLGGSRFQVAGPTAAFVPILFPIVAKYGLGGLLVAGFMGGGILVTMGLLRLGKLIEFIPHPVTTGFTAGIATVIATLQLKDLFGLTMAKSPEHFFERIHEMWISRSTGSTWELGIGLLTLAILVLFPRVTKKIPAPLVALPVAAVAAWLVMKQVPSVHLNTITSRFNGIPQAPPRPILPWSAGGVGGTPFHLDFNMIQALLPGAFAIALLGSIESLLSAVVADGMSRTKHDPDAELLAQGVANLVCPFFGGIPATGAIARTATNIRSGAKSPIASMVHAVTILAAILALAPLIGYLPMSALAALLMLVAWNMSEAKHFVHIVKVAPRNDVAILLVCFGLTVATDMVISVTTGVVLAALLFMRRMALLTRAKLHQGAHPAIPRSIPDGVFIYDIAGPLFFGAAQKAMATLRVIADKARVVILRMDQVPDMDATGLVALESALERLEHHRCLTVIVGLQRQPRRLLRSGNVKARFSRLRIRPDLHTALLTAEEHLTSVAGTGGSSTRIRLKPPPPKPA